MIAVMGLFSSDDGCRRNRWRTAADGGLEVDAALLPAGGCVLNHVRDRSQKGIDYDRGTLEVDAIAELVYPALPDPGSVDLIMASMAGALGYDQARRIGMLTTFRNTVLEPPSERSRSIKRMSLLRRREGVKPDDFKTEWFYTHSLLVRRMPGVLGYRQNLVVGSSHEAGRLQVDGIVELWFRDAAATEHAFRSVQGNTTMTHAREFIADITAYLVEPQQVTRKP